MQICSGKVGKLCTKIFHTLNGFTKDFIMKLLTNSTKIKELEP